MFFSVNGFNFCNLDFKCSPDFSTINYTICVLGIISAVEGGLSFKVIILL